MKKDNYGQMERLLDMTEYPDQYTDEQLNELLHDDELRQAYQLISDITSAYEYRRTSDKLTDGIIEEEQHKLMEERSTSKPVHRYYRQVVAVVIGILTVSGTAVATVSVVRGSKKRLTTDSEIAITNNMTRTKTLQEKGSTRATVTCNKLREKKVGEILPPKQLDNVMLRDVIQGISDYYGTRTVCCNPEARQLHLRFLWDRDQSVEHAVGTLNMFEKVQLTLADSTITIG